MEWALHPRPWGNLEEFRRDFGLERPVEVLDKAASLRRDRKVLFLVALEILELFAGSGVRVRELLPPLFGPSPRPVVFYYTDSVDRPPLVPNGHTFVWVYRSDLGERAYQGGREAVAGDVTNGDGGVVSVDARNILVLGPTGNHAVVLNADAIVLSPGTTGFLGQVVGYDNDPFREMLMLVASFVFPGSHVPVKSTIPITFLVMNPDQNFAAWIGTALDAIIGRAGPWTEAWSLARGWPIRLELQPRVFPRTVRRAVPSILYLNAENQALRHAVVPINR